MVFTCVFLFDLIARNLVLCSGLAGDDVTRLAVALAYKPEADVAKGALPESEARELYSLYSSRHGRAQNAGAAPPALTALQEEMLRRVAKYLGLL